MLKRFPGFADRLIMRTLACGYPVPWPEQSCFGNMVFRKDYRMNDFPRLHDGTPWYEIPDDEYCAWLADYLPDNLPELTDDQKIVKGNRDTENFRLSGFRVGDIAGWFESESALRPFHEFEPEFFETGDFRFVHVRDSGYSHDDYLEYIAEIDVEIDVVLSKEEYILDDLGWMIVLDEARREYQRYWPDFGTYGDYFLRTGPFALSWEPPDAGWRIYLGLVLQVYDSHEERVREVMAFYQAFQDIISK